jgi:outer membrane immunogenic protein
MKNYVSIAVGSAALAAAFAGGAFADGIPARRAPAAPVVEDRCGTGPWTGFYVGGNIGAAWTQSEFRDRDGLFNQFGDFEPRNLNHTESGFTGGVQAGYNYQCKAAVFGIEGDFNGIANDSNERHFFPALDGTLHRVQRDDNATWFSTIRGRVGWTDNKFLVYATGGVAFSDLEHEVTGVDNFGVLHRFKNDTDVGWTGGGGVEYLHSRNITFRVEALWVGLNTDNDRRFALGVLPGGECGCPVTRPFHFDREDELWTLRVGVNYLFGGREPEVVPLK